MEDLQEKIAQIMSDPQSLSQIQSLGKMLGLGDNSKTNPPPVKPPEESNPPGDMLSGEALGKISKLMPVFRQLQQEDDATRLLSALRPFLSEEKRRRLDSAGKMLHFIRVIPLLKEVGLGDSGLF